MRFDSYLKLTRPQTLRSVSALPRRLLKSHCICNLLRRHRPGKFSDRIVSATITDRHAPGAVYDLPLNGFCKCLFGGFGLCRHEPTQYPALNLERHGKPFRRRARLRVCFLMIWGRTKRGRSDYTFPKNREWSSNPGRRARPTASLKSLTVARPKCQTFGVE